MATGALHTDQPKRRMGWRCALRGTAAGIALLGVSTSALADAVLTWNSELLSVIRQTSPLLVNGPPEVARQIAIVGAAMSDAASAATGGRYSSYAYTGGPVAGASAEAAALSAGYTAMTSIFSNPVWQGSGSNPTLINTVILPGINSVYANALSSLGNGAAVTAGVNLGISAANAVIQKRSNDGAVAAIMDGLTPQAPPGSGAVPGVYVPPSTAGGRPAMFPQWGTVSPFGITPEQGAAIKNGATMNGTTLPALGSEAYAKGLLETQCVGTAGTPNAACAAAGFAPATPAQKNAALFWNDPGGTLQPPGHWLQIANGVMQDQNLTLAQKARLTSLLGMAMMDAGLYAWDLKYQYNLWRPIDAIRACDTVANNGTVTWSSFFATCELDWQSLIATPPHPDYPAGHPAFSAAAASVLAGFLGTDKVAFCSTSDPYTNGALDEVGEITICFDSFSAASGGPLGSTYSRVIGGIHSPFAVNDAESLGKLIGAQILANFEVEPIPEPASLALLVAPAVALAALRRRSRAAGNGAAT